MMKFKPMDDCEVHGVWVRDIPDNLIGGFMHSTHLTEKKTRKFVMGSKDRVTISQ